jgi:peptidyl-prolyl cis-trans isomerase C
MTALDPGFQARPVPPLAHVALAAVLALAAACAEPVPPDAVARVGESWISTDGFEIYLERTAGEDAADLSSEVLSKLLDRYLEEEMLARLAVERGVAKTGDPHRRAIDRLLRAEPIPEPSEEEVERYYREHREDYKRAERVRLRQILVEDRETMERALEELRSGEDFGEVARRYSRDSTGETGGVQGELTRDELPPMFADTIFKLEPGEISDIVEAEYGFHLFQVMERLPAEVLPLDQVAEEIRRRLREQSADQRLDHLVREARNRYPVRVQIRNLPFDYRGEFYEQSSRKETAHEETS